MSDKLELGHCASLSCIVLHTQIVRSYLNQRKPEPAGCHWCGALVPVPKKKATSE